MAPRAGSAEVAADGAPTESGEPRAIGVARVVTSHTARATAPGRVSEVRWVGGGSKVGEIGAAQSFEEIGCPIHFLFAKVVIFRTSSHRTPGVRVPDHPDCPRRARIRWCIPPQMLGIARSAR
jgi:hypothetical protein